MGKKRCAKEKKAKKEGRKVEYTEKQRSHMDTDASFSIKLGQVHHGYKLSTKTDIDYELIRDFETDLDRFLLKQKSRFSQCENRQSITSQHDATIEQIELLSTQRFLKGLTREKVAKQVWIARAI